MQRSLCPPNRTFSAFQMKIQLQPRAIRTNLRKFEDPEYLQLPYNSTFVPVGTLYSTAKRAVHPSTSSPPHPFQTRAAQSAAQMRPNREN